MNELGDLKYISGYISESASREMLSLNKPVYDIYDIPDNIDYIIRPSNDGINMAKILDEEYSNLPVVIQNEFFLLKIKLIDKYKDSNDEEIKEILKYWIYNDLNIFGTYYNTMSTCNKVFRDEDNGFPYIEFDGKRMYYPKDYNEFKLIDGKEYIIDILSEQGEKSPHLYIDGDIQISKGDVLVDAGVCEGNFALRYIDIVDKVYLVECDDKWMEALKLTFKPYNDKVIFCNKMLTDKDDEDSISLDTLVKGRVDFIKMDIEGAEAKTLLGGKSVFAENNIKCAICSYHKHGDEQSIKNILDSYGYKNWTSKGYMIFVYGEDIFRNPEVRRGIVYGKKS